MTFYPLKDSDHFVTRIEAYPEWELSGTAKKPALTTPEGYQFSSSFPMTLRSYLNAPGHSYYRIASDIPERILTSSVIFYEYVNGSTVLFDSVNSSSMARTIKNLAYYYSQYPCLNFKGAYDDLANFDFYDTTITNGSRALVVVSIPKYYFGKEIKKGTFICIFDTKTVGGIITRGYVYDDMSGSIFVSVSSSAAPVIYYGKVGNIFYNEGIVAVTGTWCSSIYGFPAKQTSVVSNYQIFFTGSYGIYTLNTFCHVGEMDGNFSNNSSSFTGSSDYGTNIKILTGSNDKTWITGVSLYDAERKMICSAKLSHPIRKKPGEKLLFKIRNDY